MEIVGGKVKIATYVFFKIETTGAPWNDPQPTKIIELVCYAVPRKVLARNKATDGCIKTFYHLINPERSIHPECSQAENEDLDEILFDCPTFRQIYPAFYAFLAKQPKPVCLIAHNGNSFDFRLITDECSEINKKLPDGILCVDSKLAFQNFLKPQKGRRNYNLPALYKRFTNEEINPDGAKEKAEMLICCVVYIKDFFVAWADENCKEISKIKPFYTYSAPVECKKEFDFFSL